MVTAGRRHSYIFTEVCASELDLYTLEYKYMKPINNLPSQKSPEFSFAPYDEIVSARRQLGLSGIEWKAFVQLYRNKVNVGEPYYSHLKNEFQIEIGTRNDHKNCLHVLDRLLENVRHGKSCGLARVAYFDDLQQWLAFSTRLSMALWIGYQAQRMQEIARENPNLFYFDD